MPNTRLICPVCHSEFAIDEHEHVVTGTTLAHDSNLGTVEMQLERKEPTNMSAKIELLQNAGVDTSRYFSITTLNGNECVMEMRNGTPYPIDINTLDTIEEDIFANGYVKNTKLHRRWITAQTMRAINFKSSKYGNGYNAYIKSLGYNYQWKMMLEEIRVLWKLQESDSEMFEERSKFFNRNVVCDVIDDYIVRFKDHVTNNIRTSKCKGLLEYKRLPYPFTKHFDKGDVFVIDLEKKVFYPMFKELNHIAGLNNYKNIYISLKRFINNYVIKMPSNTNKCDRWVDAYKGAGAWYSLQNMVRFGGIRLVNYYTKELLDTQEASEKYLYQIIDEHNGCRYKTLALLMDTIERNNYNLGESIDAQRNNANMMR